MIKLTEILFGIGILILIALGLAISAVLFGILVGFLKLGIQMVVLF